MLQRMFDGYLKRMFIAFFLGGIAFFLVVFAGATPEHLLWLTGIGYVGFVVAAIVTRRVANRKKTAQMREQEQGLEQDG